MSDPHLLPASLGKLRGISLAVGLIGAAACLAGAWLAPHAFYPAYLIAYLFWLGVALGSLAIALLHHLTGGAWGIPVRRPLEAAYSTLPLLTVLFLPIVLGMEVLYEWTHADLVAADPILQGKSQYLNERFFQARAIGYFVIWILVGFVLNRLSSGTNPADEPLRQRRLALVSGPGLILWGLSVTFASIDWAMSLEPHWFSSMYGVLYMGGFAVSGMAVAIVTAAMLTIPHSGTQQRDVDRLNDLGNLLMAFTVFWSYVSFMQYLIIWSGNLPEDNVWYVHRASGGWEAVAMLLIGLHFVLPFLLLLSRANKRDPSRLIKVCVLLLVMRLVDVFWLVQPAFSPKLFNMHILHLVTTLTIGGFWLAWYAWRLPARAALPVYELPSESEAGAAAHGTH